MPQRPDFCHFGDPCVHCNTPHDLVAPGACLGDKTKVVVIRYRKVETRPDGVEHYVWQTSDGKRHECWSHVTNRLPYYHFGLRDDLTNPPQYAAWLAA